MNVNEASVPSGASCNLLDYTTWRQTVALGAMVEVAGVV